MEEIAGLNEKQFQEILNRHTLELQKLILKLANSTDKDLYWGSARKALNLFFESACYHAILRKDFRVDDIESYLEVPIDNQVANHLYSFAKERNSEPPDKWDAIKRLKPEISKKYQAYANQYARELECSRVQLDLILWRPEE